MRHPLGHTAGRRPLTVATGLTLLWHGVLFAVAELLPPLSPDWFPDLGAAVVNVVLAALTVALLVWLGWSSEAGLAWRRPDRSWWLAVPLLAEALSYAVPGLAGTATEVVSTGLLALTIGLAEETLSRGLVQRVLQPLGPVAAAVWVGVLFGAGHALSGAWFGRDPVDTAYIVVSAGVYGFCLAALRWHLGTIWPLVALHALTDFTQLASPGNLPFALRVVVVLAVAAYGWWLLRPFSRRPAGVARSAG